MARPTRQSGVTFIELVASIVIVSIAVLGLMLAVTGVTGQSGDPLAERQGVAIAHSYLEEVLLAGFCDPDAIAVGQTCKSQCTTSACGSASCGGTAAFKEGARSLYDNVCDYDGLSDTGAEDRNGAPIAGLELYDVSVSVRDAGVSLGPGGDSISASAGQVVRIDVSVSHPALDSDVGLSVFKANTR